MFQQKKSAWTFVNQWKVAIQLNSSCILMADCETLDEKCTEQTTDGKNFEFLKELNR